MKQNRPADSPRPGSAKERVIRFARAGQVEQASLLLAGLEGLKVGPAANGLTVHYDIADYTLEGIEKALVSQGFKLETSLYSKIRRTLVYFCEETELRNMRMPERLIKKSNEIYVKAWEHHPHGDHDDTPLELREDK